ncbi:Putative antitoxin YwqK [Sporomusa rhizae]|uniref:toxin-antitoxin system YwqK family antitoxin n=1 Tax=Sporomusa rhizae TaxID=357999 RepID=UPI00352A5162
MGNNVHKKEYVIANGVDFEDLWFSSKSDEVLDNAEDDEGKPFTGLSYELYDNGMLTHYCYFVDGFKHGDYIEFYKNGNIKSRQYMKYGTIRGKEETWYESGEIKSVAEYEFGICLSCKEWDKKGDLIFEKLEPTESDNAILLKERAWNKKLGRD